MSIKVSWSNQEVVNEITHPTIVSYQSDTDWSAICPGSPHYNTKIDPGVAVGHAGELVGLQVQEKTEKLSVPYTIHKNDVISFARAYTGEKFHALLSDPPYHLTSTVKRFGGKNAAPAQQGTDGAFARASKGFMGKCYAPGTELLTEDGWFDIKDIVDSGYSGNLYTINPDTLIIEMQKAIEFQKYEFNGQLVHLDHRSAELLVTENHNLLTRQDKKWGFRRADDSKNQIPMLNQGIWYASTPLSINICGKEFPTMPFMRFLGIYLGDGCIAHRINQPQKQNFISIAAKISRKHKHIKEVLDQLGVFYTQYEKQTLIYDKQLMEWLEPLGKSFEKFIPNHLFNFGKNALEELWQGLLKTDGHESSNVTQYFTTSKRLADDVQRLLLHIGLSGTIGFRKARIGREINGHVVKTAKDGYVISVLKPNKKIWFERVDHKTGKINAHSVDYSGFVYDVTVSRNHTLMTRRNGKTVWSSNSWDGGQIAFDPETWCAFLELLHPGAFGMAFASSRGWHRMACAIEDAGFIIHPSIFLWGFGSGFPKATRIKTDRQEWENYRYGGQAIKPAAEPIIVFQRPYEGKPIDSILKTGAGALGIMNAKIGSDMLTYGPSNPRDGSTIYGAIKAANYEKTTEGRWPANLVLGHSRECTSERCVPDCAVFKLGEQSGSSRSKRAEMSLDKSGDKIYGKFNPTDEKSTRGHTDEGTAARFFFNADWNAEVEEALYNADPVRYCPKSSTAEREAGLTHFNTNTINDGREKSIDNPYQRGETERKCTHPTVKPISLAEHLARLLLPPVEYAPRRILIPFSGVSSEMIGACKTGWDFVCGIENEQEYVDIGNARLKYHVDR